VKALSNAAEKAAAAKKEATLAPLIAEVKATEDAERKAKNESDTAEEAVVAAKAAKITAKNEFTIANKKYNNAKKTASRKGGGKRRNTHKSFNKKSNNSNKSIKHRKSNKSRKHRQSRK